MEMSRVRKHWSRIRTTALLCMFGAVVLVLGKTILVESLSETETVEVKLPNEIPLNGWETITADELKDQTPDQPNYLTGKEYQYTQETINLTIQARYISGTNGNVRSLIDRYISASLERETWETHTLENVGSFLLKADQEGVNLSSCINPYGGATVSIKDYQFNRNFHDIRHRFVPWLLGNKLKDERCLWTHMSASHQVGEPSNVNLSIEDAWEDWYRWWAVHLPNMEY